MKEKLSLEEAETQQILLNAADSDLITIQSRQLTQYHKLNFVSIKIHVFSLQNLVWVVKNLKMDRVTPIQSTVISRIKQCFGLNYKTNLWHFILEQFYDMCS